MAATDSAAAPAAAVDTDDLADMFSNGEFMKTPGRVLMERVAKEDLEPETPNWVHRLLYLSTEAAHRALGRLPAGSLEALPLNARKAMTRHLMPNQGAAAEMYQEMVQVLREDAVVVSIDEGDPETFCRAARVRATPSFILPIRVDVEWFNVHEPGWEACQSRNELTRRRRTLSPEKLQLFHCGDSLTAGGLAKPLPVEDREAVYAHWHKMADVALRALGPRPGTGELAVPEAAAGGGGNRKKAKGAAAKAAAAARKQRQADRASAKATAAKAATDGFGSGTDAGTDAAKAAYEELNRGVSRAADLERMVADEVARHDGVRPRLLDAPGKAVESEEEWQSLMKAVCELLDLKDSDVLTDAELDWALVMCYLRGKTSFVPARVNALRLAPSYLQAQMVLRSYYEVEKLAMVGSEPELSCSDAHAIALALKRTRYALQQLVKFEQVLKEDAALHRK